MVGVLDQRPGRLHAAGAEVDGLHHLDVGLARPVDEFVQPERVRLDRVPRAVHAHRALVRGADAVLPAVPGDEVASGVPHDGRPQLAHELQHVGAEAPRVGGRMPRLVDPGVHAAPHVLDE